MRDTAAWLCKWVRFKEIERYYLGTVCFVIDRLGMGRRWYDGVRIKVVRWLHCTERGLV